MRIIEKICAAADKVLAVVAGLLACACLLYSGYVLYDNYYVGESAFASWDLLQYKPKPTADEETYDFEEIKQINPDVVGWLTIYDTNIDYPIARGKDDLEYINKDIYGKSSLSGSIYLSAKNSSDFSDSFNIIYGHHMDNGAMFGDLEKYKDEKYFMAHRDGELITPDKSFDLKVFASITTHAYESRIYSAVGEDDGIQPLLDFIKENADNYVETEHSGINKLIAFSTCMDSKTNGRTVIFCYAEPKKSSGKVVPVVADYKERHAKGHFETAAPSWALLNLICVLIVLYTLLPLTHIQKKFRQMPYSRKKANTLEEKRKSMSSVPVPTADIRGRIGDTIRSLRRFHTGMIIGLVLEILIFAGSVVTFLLTENMHARMVMSDEWTWLMVLLSVLGLAADFAFFRYHRRNYFDYEY